MRGSASFGRHTSRVRDEDREARGVEKLSFDYPLSAKPRIYALYAHLVVSTRGIVCIVARK